MKISPETTSGKPKKVMILVPCPPGPEDFSPWETGGHGDVLTGTKHDKGTHLLVLIKNSRLH